MHERLKAIKAIAKNLKLRLPFEPANDNMHDLLEGIIALCDEPVLPPFDTNGPVGHEALTTPPYWVVENYTDERVEYPGPNGEERRKLLLGDWAKEEKTGGVQWSMDPKSIANSNETTKMVSYYMNDQWISIGIPKKQPFHEQLFWAANRGATKIKMSHEGQETEIEIFQYKES